MKASGEIFDLKGGKCDVFAVKRVLLSPLFPQLCITLYLILSIQFLALGLSYYTINNGDWNNTTNVWSTNSATACSCSPSSSIDGFSVIIRHTITMTSDIHIRSGNSLTININSELSGSYDITVQDGDLNSNGTIGVDKMQVKNNGRATFFGPVNVTNNFIVEGVATINAVITLNNGNFENKVGAMVLVSPNSQINLLNGNVDNHGSIDFDSSCVEMDDGNFDNSNNALVTGIGYIKLLGGNITNNGSWSTGVDWCVSGSGTGISVSENCSSDNCNAPSVLPIELVFFKGNLELDKVILTWQTATESNNEYFTVERRIKESEQNVSAQWKEIGVIPGAGNSNTVKNYRYLDESSVLSEPSTLYYRLKQTDYDGKYQYSDLVAIEVLPKAGFSVHPNPTTGRFTVEMFFDEPQVIHLEVFDLLGHRIYAEESIQTGENMPRHIDLSGHARGIYNLQLTNASLGTMNKTIVLR